MARIDFYRVLGSREIVSDYAIRKAYRKLVFQHHPTEILIARMPETKIRELNAAYEVIGESE